MVDHFERTTKAGEGFSVDGVRMAGGVQVWPGLVDLTVDGKGRAVDGALGAAGLNLAVLVDEDKV